MTSNDTKHKSQICCRVLSYVYCTGIVSLVEVEVMTTFMHFAFIVKYVFQGHYSMFDIKVD